jgi:formylmethanofuran dehydrogenase subunit B
MVQVICDVCGKPVKDAHVDINYVYRLGRDICMPCHEKLTDAVDKKVEAKAPYSFGKYWVSYGEAVKRMSKG